MSVDNSFETKNMDLKDKEENVLISLSEEDFENAYNYIFREGEPIEEQPSQEEDIENNWYHNHNPNIFIKNEDPVQIDQIYNNLEIINDKKSKEGNINEKNSDYTEDNELKNIEIEIKEDKDKEDEMKKVKTVKEQKVEQNRIVIEEKKNRFRTYNSQEYNLFHPGGIVNYFKYITDEIRKESLNPKKKKDKLSQNQLKFNIYINNKKKKKSKDIKKRKDKPDNIRKKIKSRFLKILKTRINEKLKSAKSEEFFDNLPQCFISNISKDGNKFILDMTIKELLTKNFFEDGNSNDNSEKVFIQKKRNPNKDKYEKNQKVLEYLDRNSNISKSSNFNVISKLTFREIFKEYLKSEEFEKDILKLKNKDNNERYIKDYINKAYNFLEYFSKNN